MTAGLQGHQQAALGDAEVTRPGTETAGCSQANQMQEAEYGLASDYRAVQVAVTVELELQGLKGQESLLLTVDQLAVGPIMGREENGAFSGGIHMHCNVLE